MAHIHINCTDEQLAELTELARASRTSVSALGQKAIVQLITAARAGATPMIVPSTLKNAELQKEALGITFYKR